MSYVSTVLFTMGLAKDDDLAAAAAEATRAMEAFAATLPDPPHDDPRFESPYVHWLMQRVAEDPAPYVQWGNYADCLVWGGEYNPFVVTGELRRPAEGLQYLAAFVEAVAARRRHRHARATLIVSPEEEGTDVYTIESERGTTTVTDARFDFDL